MDNIFYFYRDFYEAQLKKHSDMVHSVDDYDWYNKIYEGLYKWAHVEHYRTGKVEVLHIVTMPKASSGKPIFGLDVVAINGKITMVCADFTPTLDTYTVPHPFKNSRELPDWADFFSPHLLLTTPEDEKEAREILNFYAEKLQEYLQALQEDESTKEPEKVVEKQNTYIESQRKNNKTFKALAVQIGKEKAGKFIKEILFPEVKLTPKEKEIQKFFDFGKNIRETTAIEHKKAERTQLSYDLITGNISEEHYKYYLQFYYNTFKVLKSNSKVCQEIFPFLERDYKGLNVEELELTKEIKNYIKYLESNPKTWKGHIYTLALGFCYGGKMIAKKIDFPKSHLQDLPDKTAFEVRKETFGCDTEDVKSSFDWTYKIYSEINTL